MSQTNLENFPERRAVSYEALEELLNQSKAYVRELQKELEKANFNPDTAPSQRDVARAVQQWRDIYKREHGVEPSLSRVFVDLDHSALFARLLQGKIPLPEAPPTAYSYPWYSIVESRKPQKCEVYFADHPHVQLEADRVLIAQNGRWRLEKRISENEAIVSWKGQFDCRVTKNPESESVFSWTIQRITDVVC